MSADVRVLILAAGSSSRMHGRDKLMEPVEGIPLLSRQVAVAQSTGRPVTVALPPRPNRRYEEIGRAEGLEVADAASGMGHSLAAGVAHLSEADAILILLADLPEITAGDLEAVLRAERRPDEIARGAALDGRPGHPILIPKAAFPDFMALRGDDGGRGALARHPVRLVPLPGEHAVLDLDTPEEWERWRAAGN